MKRQSLPRVKYQDEFYRKWNKEKTKTCYDHITWIQRSCQWIFLLSSRTCFCICVFCALRFFRISNATKFFLNFKKRARDWKGWLGPHWAMDTTWCPITATGSRVHSIIVVHDQLLPYLRSTLTQEEGGRNIGLSIGSFITFLLTFD